MLESKYTHICINFVLHHVIIIRIKLKRIVLRKIIVFLLLVLPSFLPMIILLSNYKKISTRNRTTFLNTRNLTKFLLH